MTSTHHRFAVGIIAVFGLTACASAPVNGTSEASSSTGPSRAYQLVRSEEQRMAPAERLAAGEAMADFGTNLFQQLPADGNLAISPYSVYTALAMTRPGAEGACATALDDVLGPESAGTVTAVDHAMAVAEGMAVADSAADHGQSVVFDPANSIWAAEGSVVPEYLDDLATGFDAGLQITDFQKDPEMARSAINDWVAERTHGLIPDIIGPGAITTDTKMTLVNALYLAAPWATLFRPEQPIAFSAPSGNVSAPAFGASGEFAAASGDGWQSVTLPYVGGGVAMTLIVPDAGQFAHVSRALDAGLVGDATHGTVATFSTLTIPEFGVDSTSSLQSALRPLGLSSAFDDGCFTGIVSGEALAIAGVSHKAVVDVDVDGTIAAAATGLTMPEPVSKIEISGGKELVVDRPFFFVIHDTVTGAPLFLGRIVDPTA